MVHAEGVHRVAIVGPVASGKTTMATCLGTRLDLPIFDLDAYYWRQTPLPTDDEWVAMHGELVRGEQWIISGDYRTVADVRFAAADTVVWLDLPRTICLFRATVRRMKGNPTPLIDCWRWIWRYAKHGREDTAASLSNPRHSCTTYRLRSSSEVTAFLSRVSPYRTYGLARAATRPSRPIWCDSWPRF
jgi:adenylate kinase family enzyme